jgi:uncharacterized Fe-S cluster-containing radical SAM superfamily protein
MQIEPCDLSGETPSPSGPRLFDPVALAAKTEQAVCQEKRRKYSRFGWTINYGTGIATGYAVGCCLRCVFCWASETRDNIEKSTEFYSPQEVFDRLSRIAKEKGTDQIRISDGEPTIGKEHLLEVLDLAERSPIRRFVLETNGLLLGADPDYVPALAKYRKLYIRVSLKAGTPEDFSRKTGAIPEAFDLPFQGIERLKDHGVSFRIAAMSADPRFMGPLERIALIGRLATIDPALALGLEEEMTVLYPDTIRRLRIVGWDLDGGDRHFLQTVPVLSRFVQVSYPRIKCLAKRRVSLRYTLKAIRELFHGT